MVALAPQIGPDPSQLSPLPSYFLVPSPPLSLYLVFFPLLPCPGLFSFFPYMQASPKSFPNPKLLSLLVGTEEPVVPADTHVLQDGIKAHHNGDIL